jgi:hypothetical protein
MKDKIGGDSDVPLSPVSLLTRWDSWFHSVIHHARYINNYSEVLEAELQISDEINALTKK